MFSVFGFCNHNFAENPDGLLRLHNLSFDRKGLIVRLARIARKVNNCCLLELKCRSTSLLPFHDASNDGVNASRLLYAVGHHVAKL